MTKAQLVTIYHAGRGECLEGMSLLLALVARNLGIYRTWYGNRTDERITREERDIIQEAHPITSHAATVGRYYGLLSPSQASIVKAEVGR